MKRDPGVLAVILPDVVSRLHEQSRHLEHAVGALKAVADLAREASEGKGAGFVGCDGLEASSLVGLAATLARAVEVPLREIDQLTHELERS